MRLLLLILVLIGAFIGVAMFVAPSQPTLRTCTSEHALPRPAKRGHLRRGAAGYRWESGLGEPREGEHLKAKGYLK